MMKIRVKNCCVFFYSLSMDSARDLLMGLNLLRSADVLGTTRDASSAQFPLNVESAMTAIYIYISIYDMLARRLLRGPLYHPSVYTYCEYSVC